MPIHHCRWVLGIPIPVHVLVSQVQSVGHLLGFDFFLNQNKMSALTTIFLLIVTEGFCQGLRHRTDTAFVSYFGPFKQVTKEGCAGPCAEMRTEAFA